LRKTASKFARPPIIAAAAKSLSSVSVISDALRLRWGLLKETPSMARDAAWRKTRSGTNGRGVAHVVTLDLD
jgi:hypothetical protein